MAHRELKNTAHEYAACPKCGALAFMVKDDGHLECDGPKCDWASSFPYMPYEGVLKGRPGHPEFYRILEQMAALHERKAADYGLGADVLANCRNSSDFGIPAWVGVAMRMNDKMTRLKALAQKGELKNEPITDSFDDIACYAIIARILYEEEQANKTPKGVASPRGE